MENIMSIAVLMIAIAISFVPMPFTYKIIGIVMSIILIALVTYLLYQAKRLPMLMLVINLITIGWELAILSVALTR
jgi:hypothetical protein